MKPLTASRCGATAPAGSQVKRATSWSRRPARKT